jgi:hypothetical protein
MERLHFEYPASQPIKQRAHVGVVGSGDLRSASLKSWSIIEESYCENLDLLLGDFFSHKQN